MGLDSRPVSLDLGLDCLEFGLEYNDLRLTCDLQNNELLPAQPCIHSSETAGVTGAFITYSCFCAFGCSEREFFICGDPSMSSSLLSLWPSRFILRCVPGSRHVFIK